MTREKSWRSIRTDKLEHLLGVILKEVGGSE